MASAILQTDKYINIGNVGDESVTHSIYHWVRRLGYSGQFAKFVAGPDMLELAGRPVVLVEGLPFVWAENNNLIPYMWYIYWLYRDHYEPTIRRMGGKPVDGLFYPLMPTNAGGFRGYMRHIGNRWTGNMLGEKAKRVEWQHTSDRGDLAFLVAVCTPLMEKHSRSLQTKYDLSELHTRQQVEFWRAIPQLPEGAHLFYAVDHNGIAGFSGKGNNVVAAMLVLQRGNDWDCSAMCFDHADEYRPYSLATCSQLAVARHVMEHHPGAVVNYGLNSPGMGEYKRVFSDAEPVYGLMASDIGLA